MNWRRRLERMEKALAAGPFGRLGWAETDGWPHQVRYATEDERTRYDRARAEHGGATTAEIAAYLGKPVEQLTVRDLCFGPAAMADQASVAGKLYREALTLLGRPQPRTLFGIECIVEAALALMEAAAGQAGAAAPG